MFAGVIPRCMPRHSQITRNGLESGYVLPKVTLARCLCGAGKLPVPILDEAHHHGDDALAGFKMLADHRMVSGNRLCQLPVGLTQLRNRLRMAAQKPPAQRIVVNRRTPALSHEEVGAYVGH